MSKTATNTTNTRKAKKDCKFLLTNYVLNIITFFQTRKNHALSLLYDFDFKEQNIPPKARPIQNESTLFRIL